jgi:hypothetical protein
MKVQPYECPGPDCPSCSGEHCDVHLDDPCDCDVVERHASDYPKDPLAAAVDAELRPLADALIDAGHKFAKDSGEKESA